MFRSDGAIGAGISLSCYITRFREKVSQHPHVLMEVKLNIFIYAQKQRMLKDLIRKGDRSNSSAAPREYNNNSVIDGRGKHPFF
jgi:hypothetical protein